MKSARRTKNALSLIGQPLFLNAISVPVTAYIIRAMGPMGYGQWTVATALVASTEILASFGLRMLFIRAVSQAPEEAVQASAYQLGLRTVLGLVAGGIALLLAVCFHYPPVVLVCTALTAVGMLLNTMAGVYTDLLQGLELMQINAGINMLTGIILTVASVVAVVFHTGPIGLTLAYVTGPALSLLLLNSTLNKRGVPVRMRWHTRQSLLLLRQGRTLGFQQIIGSLSGNVERLIVPKFIGVVGFGYYSAGNILRTRLAVVPDGLGTAYFPAIARSSQDRAEDAAPTIRELLVLSLCACLPIAICGAYLAAPLSHLLFPRSAEGCRDVIWVTIWSLPLTALTLPMGYALQASGQHARIAVIYSVISLCCIFITLGLVVSHGVQGASWAVVVRSVTSLVFLLPLFLRTFPTVFRLISLSGIAASAILMALVWLGASHFVPPVVAGIPALLGYVAALVIFRVIEPSALTLLLRRNFGSRIP